MKTEKGNVEGLLNERFQMVLLRRIQLLNNKPRFTKRLPGAFARCKGNFAFPTGSSS